VIAALPKTMSSDGVCEQIVCPSFRDAPDHLKKRFLRFEAPMGQGPSVTAPTDPKYQAECREFLVKAGWEEQYPDLWRDPLTGGGHRGEKQVIRMLLEKGGKTERPLEQLVVPPPFRLYGTGEAVGLQRVRMAAEESAQNPTPLQRLDKAHEELTTIRQANAVLSGELAQVQRRGVPNNLDALKAEVMVMRKLILATANRLKSGSEAKTEAA
jgi:hypothetical protein